MDKAENVLMGKQILMFINVNIGPRWTLLDKVAKRLTKEDTS